MKKEEWTALQAKVDGWISGETHLADTQIIVKPCSDINKVILSLGGVDRVVDPWALARAMNDMLDRVRWGGR